VPLLSNHSAMTQSPLFRAEALRAAGGDGDLATSGSYGNGSFGFSANSWGGLSVADAISIAQSHDLLAFTLDQFKNACSLVSSGAKTMRDIALAITASCGAAAAIQLLIGSTEGGIGGAPSTFEGLA
jgi:hypothetical protein